MDLRTAAKYNRCSCYHVASRYINMPVHTEGSTGKAPINLLSPYCSRKRLFVLDEFDIDLNVDIYDGDFFFLLTG